MVYGKKSRRPESDLSSDLACTDSMGKEEDCNIPKSS